MESISVFISGDFAPHGRVLDNIEKDQVVNLYNNIESYLLSSDICVTNLECPLVNDATKILKTGPHLKAPVKSINYLKNGNFNLVTLSNNHILDYGYEGLKSTLDVCKENGIKTVGAGLTHKELIEPAIITVKSKKIGFINFSESEFSVIQSEDYGANPFDFSAIYNTIKSLKGEVDIIFAIVHGGHEFYKYPSPEIIKKYRLLIDFGVNAVVGHHPHCHSGYETYNGGLIFYSLGNFIFDWPEMKKAGWNQGYAVKFLISESNCLNFEIIPYNQGKSEPGIVLMDEEEKILFFNDLNSINAVIQSEQLLKEEWRKFVLSNVDQYMNLIQPTNRLIKSLQNRKWLPKIFFTKGKNRLLLLNLIRCESHREMLINVLTRK